MNHKLNLRKWLNFAIQKTFERPLEVVLKDLIERSFHNLKFFTLPVFKIWSQEKIRKDNLEILFQKRRDMNLKDTLKPKGICQLNVRKQSQTANGAATAVVLCMLMKKIS